MSLEARIESASSTYQAIQQELAVAVETRQRLDAQLNENEQVKKEFTKLKGDAQIYKLIGPALVPQERAEAETNVAKRLDFIKNEIDRVEKQLTELNAKQEAKKSEIVKLQMEHQAAQTSV